MIEDKRDRSRERASARACESCRTRKVRCLQNTSASSTSCRSCIEAQRPCIFTESIRKKPRKRTDTRVAELEKEVKVLGKALENVNGGQVSPINFHDWETKDDGYNDGQAMAEFDFVPPVTLLSTTAPETIYSPREGSEFRQTLKSSSGASWSSTPPSNASTINSNDQNVAFLDVVDRGVLSMEESANLFEIYVDNLVPQFPAVVLSPGSTASHVRNTKPILFLAIIAAAAGSSLNPTLSLILNEEFRQLYADRVIVQGEKSLELVQSILITAIWYCPPDKFNQVVFYQYIHIAATMALDIGLDKAPLAPSKSASPPPEVLYYDHSSRLDSGTGESRRTLLSCYITCAGVSMTLRRPNILNFSPWMAECVSFLEDSFDAVSTDPWLIKLVQLRRIMEECSTSLALYNPSVTVNLEDHRVQLAMKGFEKVLKIWNDTFPVGAMNESLMIDFHAHNIILHEVAMHVDHGAETFRPPYLIRTNLQTDMERELSPALVNAIAACLSSTHDLLDIFLHAGIAALCAFPIINYVRMVYGSTILIKLSLSASHPSSKIGRVLDQTSIRVVQYLDDLFEHLENVVRCSGNRVASKFLGIISKLKEWYSQQKVHLYNATQHQASIEPLMHLGPQLPELLMEHQHAFGDISHNYVLADEFQELEGTRERDDTCIYNAGEFEPIVPRTLSGIRQRDLHGDASSGLTSSVGLSTDGYLEPYSSHSNFTPTPCDFLDTTYQGFLDEYMSGQHQTDFQTAKF